MENKAYSLRELKYARTKLGLMDAFIKRLKNSRFDDISIRQVCRDAEVAEKTFFNYFHEKIDVIDYYVRLRSLRTIFLALQAVPNGKYLALIDFLFARMGEELNNENVIYQIVAVMLIEGQGRGPIRITDLEKQLAFPECQGIEMVPVLRLQEWIRECVELARKHGELPPETKAEDVVVSLITILGGTLLATREKNARSRHYHYMRQVQGLWRSLGVNGQKRA